MNNNRRIINELRYLNPLKNYLYDINLLKNAFRKIVLFSNKYIVGVVKKDKYIEIAIFILNKVYFIEFSNLNYYPFRSPQVEINKKLYISKIKNLNEYLIKNKKLLKYLSIPFKSSECLCCKSILCENRWNPSFSLGICSILEEIISNLNYENKIKETLKKYYLKQSKIILIKFLGFEFNYFYGFF